jgi:hypothetical protein
MGLYKDTRRVAKRDGEALTYFVKREELVSHTVSSFSGSSFFLEAIMRQMYL